jgi:HKD family nuclease
MKTSIAIQLPSPPKKDTIGKSIEILSSSQSWGRMSVAVAYSSLAGVASLCDIVRAENPDVSFRWLLGLDDYVTQPAAIEFCCSVSNTDVRLYRSTKAKTRFHPKIFLFDTLGNNAASSMIVGSANLTFAALNKNCEAIAILDAQNPADTAIMRSRYELLWNLGAKPTKSILDEYRKQFAKFRKSRAFLLETDTKQEKYSGPILQSDAALINPGSASVCWIEVGKNTALGRELEVKGEQARFFGLEPTGGNAEFRNFLVSNGETVPLRLKYQGNAMWRLQLRADVPEVAAGLRPVIPGGLGRSPYVAVFKRTNTKKLFTLTFPRRDSMEFNEIRKRSGKSGTIGSTSAREYGWH